MAVESLIVDEWIYDTLTGSATLMALLAVDNRAPNFQQGVYLYYAPEKDPISLRQPQVPYVVIRQELGTQDDVTSLCGSRKVTVSAHQVIAWDSQSGAVSMARLQPIVNQIDTLLNAQTVSTTSPVFYLNRSSVDASIGVSGDGRVDNGISQTYTATITL